MGRRQARRVGRRDSADVEKTTHRRKKVNKHCHLTFYYNPHLSLQVKLVFFQIESMFDT